MVASRWILSWWDQVLSQMGSLLLMLFLKLMGVSTRYDVFLFCLLHLLVWL